MAKYFTQRDLDGSISYNNNDTSQRGTIRIGSTLVSIPGGTSVIIKDARFNSDGVLVVKTDDGRRDGYGLQTHFIFGPHYGDSITEYNHSCSKPSSRLSDYNRAVQAARQEREGSSRGSSSSSSSASNAGALVAGAAVGSSLIQGIANLREQKKLEKKQAEETARQQREEYMEESMRQIKEQIEMEEEMEAYERKALLESMTPEERKAFLLEERKEKKRQEELEKREAEEYERKQAIEDAKRKKVNLIFYPVLFGLIIILHVWFYMDDNFEWWQAALWGLLTLVIGAIALIVKMFVDD